MQQTVSALRKSLLEHRLTPRYEKETLVQAKGVNPLKTSGMLAMEYLHGELIETMIAYPKPLRDCARRLGVSDACISRWRLKLNLRSTGTNATNHGADIIRLPKPKVPYKHGRCKSCGFHWATLQHKSICLGKGVSGTTGV